MSDVDQEHLSHHLAHSVFSQTTGGGLTATTPLTSTSTAPPFAPQPHYGQQTTRSNAPSGRSGGTTTTTTTTSELPPPVSSTECNVHEVCYYFQQAIFILAIMTGGALVIAGAVMHVQSGELLVFVYIGVLLAGVNTMLLMIQCCVRRKQKRRSRAYLTSRQGHTHQGSAVHYNPLTTNASQTIISAPPAAAPSTDLQQYHYKHYHMHSPTIAQPVFRDFSSQGHFVQSPTESQSRFLHGTPYYRSGSVVSHHRQAKGIYQKSPPLGQHPSHRPLLTPGSQLPTPRSETAPQDTFVTCAPPPSYDDLVRSGRLKQEGTTVHLI